MSLSYLFPIKFASWLINSFHAYLMYTLSKYLGGHPIEPGIKTKFKHLNQGPLISHGPAKQMLCLKNAEIP